MSILNTSISALLANQIALQTTAQNIANVNTPGFSRQRVDFITSEAQFSGAGFLGSGVTIGSIQRVQSDFLTEQVRASTSSASQNATFLSLNGQLDNILADEQTGLSPSILNFFNAVQDVSDIPSSISARQALISEGEALTARFAFLNDRLEDLRSSVRTQLNTEISEVNALSQALADINAQIISTSGDAERQPPNDLLDQRDELLRQLSEFVSVSTVEQNDGALNVFAGQGQALVLSGEAQTLSVTETFEGNFEVDLQGNFSTTRVTNSITGGSLGGLFEFQSQTLDATQNSLGRIAIGIADSFNAQHRLGQSLDGNLGLDFFSVPAPSVIPLNGVPNTVSATITDPSALTDSNYILVNTGANNFGLTRLSDGQTTNINTGGAFPFTSTAIDGFTVSINAAGAVGEEFIIRPTSVAAEGISTVINEPRQIAAAGPLRAGEIVDANGLPTNIGTATITDVSISNNTGLPLATAITLTFDTVLNQFSVSAPPGGTLPYNPVTDSGGVQFTLAAVGNATFNIAGVPNDGDQFTIENNTNANGDNRNALSLASLQNAEILLNGTSTFQDTYGALVAEIGTSTRQAEVSELALSTLLQQATESRDSLSGVNLEEEAANLLRLQQSFQAATQLITTADQLFQTLLDAV